MAETEIKSGRYESPGQIPLIVEDNGTTPEYGQGPWVKYRLAFEDPGSAQVVLLSTFRALMNEAGYKWAREANDAQ